MQQKMLCSRLLQIQLFGNAIHFYQKFKSIVDNSNKIFSFAPSWQWAMIWLLSKIGTMYKQRMHSQTLNLRGVARPKN